MKKTVVLLLILAALATAAFFIFKTKKNNTVTPAFYYWKSVYKTNEPGQQFLDTLNTKRLYVKYFDLIWNTEANQPTPDAVIKFAVSPDSNTEIIPVVFIVNDVFKKCNATKINALAADVSSFIKQINQSNKITVHQIQFDCDWSDATRNSYFEFLKNVKAQFANDKIIFSATIRLHQIKYFQRTGIPPVERGMLMFYNMGQLQNPLTTNSIFDETISAKYIDYVKPYPLPLDYALPIFTWGVHIRNNKIISLINNIAAADLDTIKQLKNISPSENNTVGQRIATDGFFFRGEYFFNDDAIRIEEITPALALKAATILSDQTNNGNFTVSLFHLDSSNIKRYAIKDFQNIYSVFN